MKHILVLGAGRSSTSLIQYLLERAGENQWRITVGDFSLEASRAKIGSHVQASAIQFDINDVESSKNTISNADVVISLLPAHLHPLVAVRCLEFKKHLITASYVSDEMRAFDEEARSQSLLFMNECGLDPGIDHMSAMQVIDHIRKQGGVITSFESFTGGLIAKETDPTNPWRYKFTWNPRNVVMAGQSTAKYLADGKYKYIPYQQLFKRITPVHVPGYGDYEGYANRDSLKYVETYGLHNIRTMLRGTLRNKGFCSAWNILVQLGCCDDTYVMENVQHMTHAAFIDSFLGIANNQSTIQKLSTLFNLMSDAKELEFLRWSGFFDDELIGLQNGTPAQILEHILNKKWKLKTGDKDEIVMWHRFIYELQGKEHEIQASLVATGTNETYTAMAKTVGLPMAIVTKLLLQNQIKRSGVLIPTSPDVYNPVLRELNQLGIALHESQVR